MEVHQHTQSTHRKWTHYIWEFLMLFLAVFCGFLAENLREKQLEHRKEKEYMHALIKDVQKDTALINRCIRQITFIINGSDSLENMLTEYSANPEFLRKMYYLNTVNTFADFFVDFTKGTFDELKSSGNLRLINSRLVREKIQDYETVKEWCTDQHQYSYEAITKAYFYGTDIFDITCYRKYNDWISKDWLNREFLPYDSAKQYLIENPNLLTNDKIILKKYARLVDTQKAQMMGYRSYIEDASEKALGLIHEIQSVYNFN